MKRIFFSTILFLFSCIAVEAAHVKGADITWTCLGNDSFLITTTVYRDCNGVALTTSATTLTSTCGTKILTNAISSGRDITPVCPGMQTRCNSKTSTYQYGFEEYKLTSIVDLSDWRKKGCCSVDISWSVCCRSNGITTGGANQNFYVDAKMNLCQSPCQSSPEWSAPPIFVLCKSKDATLNFGVSKMSGIDSVRYNMTPLKVSSTGTASWTSPYSYNQPVSFFGFPKATLSLPRGFHLDRTSGLMKFRPMNVQQTVMAVKADLYKGGKKIGELTRDVELIIKTCASNNAPTISGIDCKTSTTANVAGSTCSGNTICFKICTADKDRKDSVRLFYGNKIPGATFKILNNGAKLEQGEFCWTPSASDTGTFSFVVTANDSKCPVPGTTSKTFTIKVTKPDSVNPLMKVVPANQCGKYKMVMSEASNKNLGNVLWFLNDTLPIGQGDSIEHTFQVKGNYKITGVLDSCYNKELVDSIKVNQITNLGISNLLNANICASNGLVLTPKVNGAVGTLSYQWTIDTVVTADSLSGQKINLKFPNRSGLYNLSFEVTDSNTGCSADKTIEVWVKESRLTEVDHGALWCLQKGQSMSKTLDLYKGAGQWSGTGVTNNEFQSKGLNTGVYEASFVLQDSFSCTEDSAIFTVGNNPTVEAGYPIYSCLASENLALLGTPTGGSWSGLGVNSNNELVPKAAGVGYHILTYYYTDSLGCSDSDKVLSTVFDYVPVVTAPDSAFSCEYGSPFSIVGSPKGGRWFGGGFASSSETLNIDPASIGTGTFQLVYTYTDTSNCPGTDTSKIIVYETPTADFKVLDTLINQNDTLPVENNSYSVSGSEYTWEVGAPTSKTVTGFEPRIVMDQLGRHDITLYTLDSISGCGDTLKLQSAVNVVKIVGNPEWSLQNLTVFPNPASNFLIVANNSETDVKMTLSTITGQVLISETIRKGKAQLDVSDLDMGTYQLRFTSKEDVRTVFLIKE